MQESIAYSKVLGAGNKTSNVSSMNKKPAVIDQNRSPAEENQHLNVKTNKALWTGLLGAALIIALSKFGLKRTLSTIGMLSASSAAIMPVLRKMTKNGKLPA